MRSVMFALSMMVAVALVGFAALLFAFGAQELGWAAVAIAMVMAIVAVAAARYDHYEGLAFVDVDGDSWVDPDDRNAWRRAELEASDVGQTPLRVGYVHWFAETESHQFTVSIGREDTIFVVENANRLRLRGKRDALETSHLAHV